MIFDAILFDLDSTLYPHSNGLWQTIRKRIDQYMFERIGIPWEQIPNLRHTYYQDYGTTLCGLQANYDINAEDYLTYVHNLPLEDYLAPNPRLKEMLFSLPQKCYVFTNADSAHAYRVMDALDITDCFDDLIDIWSMAPYCKPNREAYQIALSIAGVKDPETCAFLDDSLKNLEPAKGLGIFTILVGMNGPHESVNRCIIDLQDLPVVVPEFWDIFSTETKS
jgi:putative hydrolase of the HAD superfamily